MFKITVETTDGDLKSDISGLRSEAVAVTEPLFKAGHEPSSIVICVLVAAEIRRTLKMVLKAVAKHAKAKNKQTKTKLKLQHNERDAEILQLLAKYKEVIDVEVDDEE